MFCRVLVDRVGGAEVHRRGRVPGDTGVLSGCSCTRGRSRRRTAGRGPAGRSAADKAWPLSGTTRAGGIQPVGAQIDPVVKAADEAIALGSDADLLPLVPEERRAELDERFQAALAIKDFDVDDVAAGRRYLAAYVSFFKYAEGEDHEHHGREAHAHQH